MEVPNSNETAGAAELECLEHLEVIHKVDKPTDWVSSLAYAWKPNGRVRACLDAKELNNCIKRDHHRTPIVEEITHTLWVQQFSPKLTGLHPTIVSSWMMNHSYS